MMQAYKNGKYANCYFLNAIPIVDKPIADPA